MRPTVPSCPTARRPSAHRTCAPAVQVDARRAARVVVSRSWWALRADGRLVRGGGQQDRPSSAPATRRPRRGHGHELPRNLGGAAATRRPTPAAEPSRSTATTRPTSSTAPPPSTVRFDHRGLTDPPILRPRHRHHGGDDAPFRLGLRVPIILASCSCSSSPGGLAAPPGRRPDSGGTESGSARGLTVREPQLYSSEPGVVSSSPSRASLEAERIIGQPPKISSLAPLAAGRGEEQPARVRPVRSPRSPRAPRSSRRRSKGGHGVDEAGGSDSSTSPSPRRTAVGRAHLEERARCPIRGDRAPKLYLARMRVRDRLPEALGVVRM